MNSTSKIDTDALTILMIGCSELAISVATLLINSKEIANYGDAYYLCGPRQRHFPLLLHRKY